MIERDVGVWIEIKRISTQKGVEEVARAETDLCIRDVNQMHLRNLMFQPQFISPSQRQHQVINNTNFLQYFEYKRYTRTFKFNVVHLPCYCITYVKFNNKLVS